MAGASIEIETETGGEGVQGGKRKAFFAPLYEICSTE